jgi:hypothetical protein
VAHRPRNLTGSLWPGSLAAPSTGPRLTPGNGYENRYSDIATTLVVLTYDDTTKPLTPVDTRLHNKQAP